MEIIINKEVVEVILLVFGLLGALSVCFIVFTSLDLFMCRVVGQIIRPG